MKGFIYLLEISVALILILVVLGTVSSYEVKENWERADLIGIGDNMLSLIKNEQILDILNGNLSMIEYLLPTNIDFGLKVKGVPKITINLYCIVEGDADEFIRICTNYLDGYLLKNITVNDRQIQFFMEGTTEDNYDIDDLLSYDIVVFVNYTNYNGKRAVIEEYLDKGGVVIAINATENNVDVDFNEIFGLSPTASSASNFHFTEYEPEKDEIQKYFLGIGFDVITDLTTIDGKKWGLWNVWEESRIVNITSYKTVDIESKRPGETNLKDIPEGGFFILENPIDNTNYTFKIKKVFWSDYVTIQPVNTSFIFQDFSEEDGGLGSKDVTGKFNIIANSGGDAEMTSNNTAIWISDFPETSDEYPALVRAAFVSKLKEWYLKEPDLTKEHIVISSFFSLCYFKPEGCDMSETAELTFYLWYKI